MKHRVTIITGLLIFLALGLPTFAGMQQVGSLFADAQYEEARQSLLTSGEDNQPGEEVIWRSRLSQNPDQALALLKGSIDHPEIPESTRVGMALQLAEIYFARGDFEQAHAVLKPLFDNSTVTLPGEVYLLNGLTLRKGGKNQQAREMLASVKPHDQAFGAARYFLGDISLESNDPELALRYFESGQKDAKNQDLSRLKAGQWRALRVSGKDAEAEKLLADMRKNSGGSLALVEIGRILQREEDENSARLASASAAVIDTVATSPEETAGRYTLQLGAFSDRALALEFKLQHEEQIPTLQITEVRDTMGQFLYKLRFGSFVNPALARSEAQRQKKKLGMDVIVVELGIANGSSR